LSAQRIERDCCAERNLRRKRIGIIKIHAFGRTARADAVGTGGSRIQNVNGREAFTPGFEFVLEPEAGIAETRGRDGFAESVESGLAVDVGSDDVEFEPARQPDTLETLRILYQS